MALVFEYINGFHDTANSIATVVATRVLTPRQAVVMAACTNLVGALWGTAVATTIASGLVDPRVASQEVLICALLGAIIWNLVTWRAGLPSSSSHALVGGLVGAAVAAARSWSVVIWSLPDRDALVSQQRTALESHHSDVRVAAGRLRARLFHHGSAVRAAAQLEAAHGECGFRQSPDRQRHGHGIHARHERRPKDDGHRRPGVGVRHGRRADWRICRAGSRSCTSPPPEPGQSLTIALWIKVMCALVMAAGTAAGGWRIIKTLGHKMVRLQPVNGFAAETSSAAIIGLASHFGIPVSTTHNVSAAIMGVGAAKRFSALKWTIVERMVWAWLLTIPVSATIAYWLMRALQTVGFAE